MNRDDAEQLEREQRSAHEAIMRDSNISTVLAALQQVQPYIANPMMTPAPQSQIAVGTNANS